MHPDERRIYAALLTAWAIVILLSCFYIVVTILYQKRRVKAYLEATEAEFTLLEAERSRISAELHDHIGGSLSSLVLTLSHLPSPTPDQTKIIEDAIRLLRSIAHHTRDLAYEMEPTAFQSGSLAAGIEELLIPFYQSGLYKIDFVWNTDLQLNQPKAGFHLYRIVQEILSNIAKHAQANHITLSIYEERNNLVLSLRDDGKGFDDPQLIKPGLGLKNIRMRADLLQSSLSIDTKINEGTHYLLQVPKTVVT